MSVYYNEHDPFAAAWLRELMKAGEIPDGFVDTRDIQDVAAADLGAFTQCHFFAGIGGWALALNLAGWPPGRPVWTGSCPCQPFSAAGKQKGGGDDRHLWPHWARLIRECKPATIVGEQVESAIAHGWLDAVFDDLESEGYACGAVDLPAASVGAPHRRQRLWFVAHSECGTAERHGLDVGAATSGTQGAAQERQRLRDDAGDGGDIIELAESRCEAGKRGNLLRPERSDPAQGTWERQDSGIGSAPRLVGDSDNPRSQGRRLLRERAGECAAGATGVAGELADARHGRRRSSLTGTDSTASNEGTENDHQAGSGSPWRDAQWLPCRDGKWRPVESGLFPLAHGVSARVGRLRGYGNAIVPQVAAEVLSAFLSLEESHD